MKSITLREHEQELLFRFKVEVHDVLRKSHPEGLYPAGL